MLDTHSFVRNSARSIIRNRNTADTPYNQLMFEREARVLEMLISEGMFE